LPRWNIEELADAATTAPHRVRTIGWSRARRCLRSYVQLEPPVRPKSPSTPLATLMLLSGFFAA
jgi:hypothetical protein